MSHFLLGAGVLTVMFTACGPAKARPLHVRDSSPAAEAIVDGRNAQYVVRFDVGLIMVPPRWTSPRTERSSNCSFQLGTASPMFWRPRPLRCPQVDTSSIGMRNRSQTAISRMDSSPSQSRGDFGPGSWPSSHVR
jgi:hypothetical protein